MGWKQVEHFEPVASSYYVCTVNLRYSDSRYSDNLGYSDNSMRINPAKLVQFPPRYSHELVCIIHIAITKVYCSTLARKDEVGAGIMRLFLAVALMGQARD